MMTLTKDDLAAIEGLFTGKFNEMNDHFGMIDKRLDGIDERLDNLEDKVKEIDFRLEHVESDVSALKVGQLQLGNKLREMSAKVDTTYQLVLENWGQIEESKVRLSLLES